MNPKQIENFYPLALAVRRLFHRMGHGATVLHRESGISAGMRAVLESVIHGGPMTVPQMARAVLDLFRDRTQRETLASNGLREVAQYYWSEVRLKWLTLYADCGAKV